MAGMGAPGRPVLGSGSTAFLRVSAAVLGEGDTKDHDSTTWTPKVCRMIAFWLVLKALGQYFKYLWGSGTRVWSACITLLIATLRASKHSFSEQQTSLQSPERNPYLSSLQVSAILGPSRVELQLEPIPTRI